MPLGTSSKDLSPDHPDSGAPSLALPWCLLTHILSGPHKDLHRVVPSLGDAGGAAPTSQGHRHHTIAALCTGGLPWSCPKSLLSWGWDQVSHLPPPPRHAKMLWPVPGGRFRGGCTFSLETPAQPTKCVATRPPILGALRLLLHRPPLPALKGELRGLPPSE